MLRITESVELRNFLASPAVEREAKHGVIEKLATRMGASKIIRNFLFIMVDNQRTAFLPQMLESFQSVLQQRQGVAEASVVSATALNDGQKAQLQLTLERIDRQENSSESIRKTRHCWAACRCGSATRSMTVRCETV